MTVIVEHAIEHEIVLQGSDLERRLVDALEVVRGYSASNDASVYIDAAAAGERSGLDPFRDVRSADPTDPDVPAGPPPSDDPYGVLAAFSRH